jgi:hypothetical protein
MEFKRTITFSAIERKRVLLCRVHSLLATLQREQKRMSALTHNKEFKIIGDTAIFNFQGYAIHIRENNGGVPSQLTVYKTKERPSDQLPRIVWGSVSATLENLAEAKAFIDEEERNGLHLPGLSTRTGAK